VADRRLNAAEFSPVAGHLGSFSITEPSSGYSIRVDLTPELAVNWVATLTAALRETGVSVLPRRREEG
jgi:hypothetical protein